MGELADKPFEFDGQYYETLQQAVAASLFAEEDTCNIILRGNTSGDGATVEAWNYGIVQMDFGGFRYTLNDGKYIDTGDSYVSLKGHGGILEGNGKVIVSNGGAFS